MNKRRQIASFVDNQYTALRREGFSAEGAIAKIVLFCGADRLVVEAVERLHDRAPSIARAEQDGEPRHPRPPQRTPA